MYCQQKKSPKMLAKITLLMRATLKSDKYLIDNKFNNVNFENLIIN